MPLWRINIKGLLFGQTHENVLHAKPVEGPTNDAQFIATRFRDLWLPSIRTLHTSQLTYNTITVRDLQAPTVAPVQLPVNIAGTGSADNAVLSYVAAVIQFRSDLAGRRGRGRYYMGGIPAVAHQGGLFTQGRIDTFEALRGTLEPIWLGPTASATVKLVIFNRGPDAVHPDITEMHLRAIPGVQRRRNLGIGI